MRRGFTLAEVMVAILFLSIAMFGYIGLHMRIIHSSTTLQKRHSIRRKVDLHAGFYHSRLRGQNGKQTDGVTPLFNTPEFKELITPYLIYSSDLPGSDYDGNTTLTTPGYPPAVRHWVMNVDWANNHGPQRYVVDSYYCPKDPGW